jgi:hypothetical protein
VIRQAISCDICGAEKKQTNHWFVACEVGDELRVCGWSSRNRLRTGSKHLCGQACLHKLADDFMARVIAGKAASARRQPELAEDISLEMASMDTSVIAARPYLQAEVPARLKGPLQAPAVLPMSTPKPQPESRPQPTLVPMPAAIVAPISSRAWADESAVPLDEPPRYATRHWRADAWEREREREARAQERIQERRPENPPRRRFHA